MAKKIKKNKTLRVNSNGTKKATASKYSIDEYKLHERVQYLRQKRKMSQIKLANAAKISQSTIAQIESGRKKPSVETLDAISRALNLHIAVLFAGDDVHVFDMKRLKGKYKTADDLNPTLHRAIGAITRYARDIGF